ncbi:hypothetical protein DPEC_G00217410 [Dallia pectoralis]|uniref:Uncharacterized protein n=1 Tax=Dallia pectoralis TaxID=75939 RepID=A0ACC2G2G4_DALPE|nr:hypothetical protein DPEC_G00217410 [Dallia pectoralis]
MRDQRCSSIQGASTVKVPRPFSALPREKVPPTRCEQASQSDQPAGIANRGPKVFGGSPGASLKLPLGVGMQLMASRPPACGHIVEAPRWFDEPYQIIIIMETPGSCMNLIDLMNTTTQGAVARTVRPIWKPRWCWHAAIAETAASYTGALKPRTCCCSWTHSG